MSKDKETQAPVEAPQEEEKTVKEDIPTNSEAFQEFLKRCRIAVYLDEDGTTNIATQQMTTSEVVGLLEQVKTELLLRKTAGASMQGSRMVVEALMAAGVLTPPKGVPGLEGKIIR